MSTLDMLRAKFGLKWPMPEGVGWDATLEGFTPSGGYIYKYITEDYQARWEGFLLGVRGYV